MSLDMLVQNVLGRITFSTDFTKPIVRLLRQMVAGHMQRQRLRISKFFSTQVAQFVCVKDSNVSVQRLGGPAHPLAALFGTRHIVLSVRSLVEYSDGRVGKRFSTFFASHLVRLDVMLVLVLLREQVLVELELLPAMLTHGYLFEKKYNLMAKNIMVQWGSD